MDWSKNHTKRWLAIAVLQSNPRWLICELSSLFLQVKSHLYKFGCILIGFDFPKGIPSSYASNVGITDYLATLPEFGQNEWTQFYTPAEILSEISQHHPFYPSRPGNTKRLYLELGLDLPFKHFYRLCEIVHKYRRTACPLFWTMGGQQVGKAAISGWESLLSPALDNPELNLKI